ncbi:hypothetical protein Tco_0575206 [Tanacetum coccineum]
MRVENDSEHEADDMGFYPSDIAFTECRGDDEVELTDEEFFDNEAEIAEVDPDLLTKDIMGFKTYDDYKDDWIYEWNKDVPWVDEKPWTDTGVWTEPKPVIHTCKPFNYKTGCSKWPTCNYEWYEALEDSELKDEALRNKAIMEGSIKDYDDESSYEQMRRWDIYTNYDDTYKKNHDDNEREELCEVHEPPICTIQRFKMIKYSFGQGEEYVAIKKDEYDDLARTSNNACHTYQDRNAPVFPIFYAGPREGNIDEYWWRIYKSGNLEMLEYYALWEVIVNGDSPPPKRNVDGVEQTYPPTTVEKNLAKKNKLKERDYETEVKGSSSSNQNSQNVAFVSSNNSGSSNQAYGSNSANADSMSDAVIYSFFVNQSNSLQLNDEDLQHMMLMNRKAPKENRNKEPVRRNVTVETTEIKALVAQDGLRYDWSDQAEEGPTNFALMAYTSSGSSSSLSSDSEVSTCSKACLKSYESLKEHYDNLTKDFNKSQLNVGAYKACLESVEARLDVYKKNEIQVSDKFKTGVGFDSQVVDSHMLDSQENDRYKTSEGYHAVPPPYTGNFMPLKYDLVLADEGEYVFSGSVTSIPDVTTSKAKTSMSKPKSVGEPLIEDWISNSENENKTEFKSK